MNLTSTILWVSLRLWETVEAHSGFDFPWSPWNCLLAIQVESRQCLLASRATVRRPPSRRFPLLPQTGRCPSPQLSPQVAELSRSAAGRGWDRPDVLCAALGGCRPSHNVGSYGSLFVFWDWLCGTDREYKAYCAKNEKAERPPAKSE